MPYVNLSLPGASSKPSKTLPLVHVVFRRFGANVANRRRVGTRRPPPSDRWGRPLPPPESRSWGQRRSPHLGALDGALKAACAELSLTSATMYRKLKALKVEPSAYKMTDDDGAA